MISVLDDVDRMYDYNTTPTILIMIKTFNTPKLLRRDLESKLFDRIKVVSINVLPCEKSLSIHYNIVFKNENYQTPNIKRKITEESPTFKN